MEYSFNSAFNYQTNVPGYGIGNACSPNLLKLRQYLTETYGGLDLGCYAKRNIRNGSSRSSHYYGAAIDWRWGNVGGGRRELTRHQAVSLLNWIIQNARVLGVQQIHDYYGSRIWKIERGWKAQPKGSTMGQKWAQYFHFETHPAAWYDGTPIQERLSTKPLPPNPTPPNPVQPKPEPPKPTPGGGSVNPTRFNSVTVPSLAVLRNGHKHAEVRKLQLLLWGLASQNITIDGDFGPQTEGAVRNFQRYFKLTVDGWVGAQTWRALLDI